MYQMSADMSRQVYAEILQTRELERTARRTARKGRRPSAPTRRATWRGFVQRIVQSRPVGELAKG